MRVSINGTAVQVDKPISLRELVESKGFSIASVAMLLNGEIVSKKDAGDQPLSEGDAIEVVTLVQGG